MAGNDIERINEFVRNLTGRNEDFDISKLSSAQKARVIAWADTKGISLPLEDDPRAQATSPAVPTTNNNKFSNQADLSVGIDIQSRSELFPESIKDLKSSEELLRIFTLREIAYAENKPDPYQTLTGLFAAKEAVIKANNLSLNNLSEIEIEFSENGRPSSIHSEISISHSLDFATAIAVSMSSTESREVKKITLDEKQLDPALNTNHSNRQFNGAVKRNSKLARSFLLITLVLLSIGLGIYFAKIFI
jgi:phosphopantetheine--protein transferase-like protein